MHLNILNIEVYYEYNIKRYDSLNLYYEIKLRRGKDRLNICYCLFLTYILQQWCRASGSLVDIGYGPSPITLFKI